MIEFKDYQDLCTRYQALDKISFDYAVVEKEPSIQVMRFSGGWKDVGTWNMMAEVMTGAAKGNVTMDEACSNLNAINEVDIPILCVGCKNLIVTVSSDGILVADKDVSSSIKTYVEQIGDEDVRYAEKSWGTYTVIDVQPNSLTIKVQLKHGNQ